jgi:preprotein translocase subunit SecY
LLNFSSTACPGKVFVLLQSLVNGAPIEAVTAGLAIGVTAVIFLMVVFAQSLKVEIPLSMGRLRGYQIKWPLSFFYASTIPVILTAALVANVQLFGALTDTAAAPCYAVEAACTGGAKIASYFGFLGHFVQGQPVSGFAFWVGSTNILDLAIKGGLSSRYLIQGIIHVLFFTTFSVLFAVLYIKTSGMDTKSVARQIMNSGLQVSGFRQDERVLEAILERYILPLTIMGGIAIGLLASLTNLLGALVSGTAILLVIMIMYQFYQSIAQQHVTDMTPALRKFIK